MKTRLHFFIAPVFTLLLFVETLQAQTNTFPSTGNAGIGTTSPFASAALEMKSTSKGLLIPRMTKKQRDGVLVSSAAKGLLIYQTNDIPGFYYYDGSTWKALHDTTAAANLTLSNLAKPTAVNITLQPGIPDSLSLGSKGFRWKNINSDNIVFADATTQTTAFIPYTAGTGINVSGNIISSNITQSQWITNGSNIYYNSGNVGIGTSSPLYKLDVNGDINQSYGSIMRVAGSSAFQYDSVNYNIWIGGGGSLNSPGSNQQGQSNTANGYQALYSNTKGTQNTASGASALFYNTEGTDNTANGIYALYHNITGVYNTADGHLSLPSNTSGSANTAIGDETLNNNTTGFFNTAVGSAALGTNTTGSDNTAIGFEADVNAGNLNNATAVGNEATATASNQVRVGNSNVTSIGGYVGWSNISDGRVKQNIKQNVPGLAFVNKLQPITYNLNLDAIDKIIQSPVHKDAKGKLIQPTQLDLTARKAKEQISYTGFIAQDVETAAKSVNYDFSGVDAAKNSKDLYGLRYAEFVVPLVKAVQELNDSLMQTNSTLQSQNISLQAQINELKAMMQQVLANKPNVTTSQTILSSASLSQNIPNPFKGTTTISYILPQTYNSAQIIIRDNLGKTLKAITVSGNDKGTLNVDASTLSSGAYSYSLVIDGKIIITKQMVLAK